MKVSVYEDPESLPPGCVRIRLRGIAARGPATRPTDDLPEAR